MKMMKKKKKKKEREHEQKQALKYDWLKEWKGSECWVCCVVWQRETQAQERAAANLQQQQELRESWVWDRACCGAYRLQESRGERQ